jgi:hypothetical protein
LLLLSLSISISISLGHKITNVLLIWKVGDIILSLRSGQFRGQKGLGPLEKSLELSHYEFCPLKKNNLPHFPNQRYINSYKQLFEKLLL